MPDSPANETPAQPAAAPASAEAAPPASEPVLEIAHVLFMDIVGYSMQKMERQTELLKKLQSEVTATAGYRRASTENQLISLPTGDGMALVFFRDPLAPVECAVELAKALRSQPDLPLRMGIHTGPVYHVADINANRNVAGGGINIAQRVMDCGDAGHILLSRSVAENLSNLQRWEPYLIDLGEQEVKHGVKIQIYNLCTDEAGNRAVPRKVAAKGSASTGRRKTAFVAGIVAAVLLVAVGWFFTHRRSPATSPESTAAATPAVAAEARSFSYSIQVQRYRDGKPYKDAFVLPGEMIFEKDYRIRLQIASAQPGYLYALNQGPPTASGASTYNILFPGSGDSAHIEPDQTVRIPASDRDWIVFDEQEGVEQLWLVWTTEASPIFESAKAFGDAKHQGAISDASLALQIQDFLKQQSAADTRTVRDESNQRTTVSGNGPDVVKLVKLEHH